MTTDLEEIRNVLIESLKKHEGRLRVTSNSDDKFEVTGTKEAMQGKQKVAGYYFASVVPKPKDIRFYFFPIYTHAESFASISDAVGKCLKGKSCFHIKQLDDAMKDENVALS